MTPALHAHYTQFANQVFLSHCLLTSEQHYYRNI